MRPTVRWMLVTCSVTLLVAACESGGSRAVGPTSPELSSTEGLNGAGAQARDAKSSELLGLWPGVVADSNSASSSNQPTNLYVCTADSVAHTKTATIGPLGGVIAFGPHSLILPPGAVLKRTVITATAPADGHVSAQFAPQGLHFVVPALLTLNYRQCASPPVGAVSIVYLESLLGKLLEILPTRLDLGTHSVSAPILHFSVYAVADRGSR